MAFRTSGTSERLTVRESREAADSWREGICDALPIIDLEAVIRVGKSSKEQMQESLVWWTATASSFLKDVNVRKSADKDGETWTYYVDRPSPLFIPPFYRTIYFRDGVVTMSSIEGYGGCK